MRGKEAVVFRGDRHGLSLQIDQEAPFGDIVDELRRKLASAEDFFRGAEVRIRAGDRLQDEVESRVLQELIRAHGLILAEDDGGRDGVEQNTSPGNGAERAAGFAARPAAAARPAGLGEPCLLVERTLRSGQRIEFDGSVVVLGDVNPGADVVATGNVVVLGALRGMVHAGAAGNTAARVIALRLHPTQLRIAQFISRPPDGEPPVADGPEVALISGGHIQIERYETQPKL